MKTKTKRNGEREKRSTRNEIHKRGKYNNTARSYRSHSIYTNGIKRRRDTATTQRQRHNGDNKYEYATEKRLKWVSSKCTHYYTDRCFMSPYAPHHRHQAHIATASLWLLRKFCGGYFFSLESHERLRVSVYVAIDRCIG